MLRRRNQYELSQRALSYGISNNRGRTNARTLAIAQEPLLAAFLLGIYVANEINYITGITNVTTIVYALLGVVIIVRIIVKRSVLLNEFHCLFPFVVSALLVMLALFRPSYSSVSLVHVAVFAIMPFFIFIEEASTQRTLRSLMLLSLLLIPTAIILRTNQDETWTMPLSYALTTPVVASIVYMRYFRKTASLFDGILALLSVCFFVLMILYGKRGPVLVVITCCLMCFIKPDTRTSGFSSKQLAALLFVATSLAVIVSNIEATTTWVSELLGRSGIEASSINRTLILATSQYGVDAGRGELLRVGIDLFLERPLFGHGVGSFRFINSGGHIMTYPHNFVIQLLDDGGIVLTALVLYPIVRAFLVTMVSNNMNDNALFIFLFSLAIPHFLVSSEIFYQPELWCLLSFSHYLNTKKPVGASEGMTATPLTRRNNAD